MDSVRPAVARRARRGKRVVDQPRSRRCAVRASGAGDGREASRSPAEGWTQAPPLFLGARARVDHVDDRAANFRIGEIGHPAARWHGAVPMDRRAHDDVETFLGARQPRRAVPDPGGATDAGAVAANALRFHDRLAGPHRSDFAGGLGPMPAGLVDHVRDGALELDIGELGVAAVRRHLANAGGSALAECGEAARGAGAPRLGVADARRAAGSRAMARDAERVDHLLARTLADLRIRAERNAQDHTRDQGKCPRAGPQQSTVDRAHEKAPADDVLHRLGACGARCALICINATEARVRRGGAGPRS